MEATLVVLVLWAGYVTAMQATVVPFARRTWIGLLLAPAVLGLVAMQTARPAAVAAGVLIALIGLGHLAWALGVSWPALIGTSSSRT